MSLTFNIADLHGRSDLAVRAVKAINRYLIETQDSANNSIKDHTIVFTGDYVDRGPDSRGVIDFVINLQKESPNVIALKGNHETFYLDAYLGKGIDFWITYNGGLETYKSYGINPGEYKQGAFPEEHVNWIRRLPLYYDDGKRVYVHAGIRNYEKTLSEHKEEDLIWMLYGQKKPFGEGDGLTDSPAYFGKHVVHGHHQFVDGPKLFTNRSNFDTLAWYTGRLVIGVFDNEIGGGPIDAIEVIGKSYKELLYGEI